MDLFNSAAFNLRADSLLSEWPLPGLAIAIVQNNITASKAFGKADLDHAIPIATDTLFDIASCSKSFTAASLALLIDDDDHYLHVQWESTMSSLMPDDFAESVNGCDGDITIEDVLSHRSGYPRYDFSFFSAPKSTPQSITRNLRNLDTVAPIRTKHVYSNMMYIVASYLVEHLSGVSFAEFLRIHFWSPLGMNSTHLQPDSAIEAGLKDRIATPYTWFEESKSYKPVQLMQVPEAQGAGSIFTSVDDHIKWIQAIMNQQHPFSPEIYRSLVRPRIITDPDSELQRHVSPDLYAAGWDTLHYRGYEIIHHNGYASGFGSFQFFLPELGFGGVTAGNSESAGGVGLRLCLELVFDMLNVTPTEWPEWGAIPERNWYFEEVKKMEEADAKELREELCPGMTDAQPQQKPLSEYTGRYWNPGYQSLDVDVRNDRLFINATDRSNAFTLTFEHMCEQTQYVANMFDWYDGDDRETAAVFEIENGNVVRMGLRLEGDMDDLIWFHKSSWDGRFAHYEPDWKQIILTGKAYSSSQGSRGFRQKRKRYGKRWTL